MTFVMRDTRGQRSLALRAPVTCVGCRCSPSSLVLDFVVSSGRGLTFVDSADSMTVGRSIEELSSDSDSDVPLGPSSSGCVGGGSGKSSSA
eukprot:4754222-Pleurochrysis_carterae.AAC.1